MTLQEISNYRLSVQLLSSPEFKSPKEIVSHFGAMQAQDYAMAKWAVGIRCRKSRDEIIEEAVNSAEILRTHILRPTWHFVAAEDIRWMLKLTGANVMRQMAATNKQLELDDKVFARCNEIIAKSLDGGNHHTREEIMQVLQSHSIRTDSFRSAHIMFHAELSGLVCSGIRKGKNNTYALLDERVPESPSFTKEEALAELARRYFTSHGPATLKDFQWWSGLSAADTRMAIALNGQKFETFQAESSDYYVCPSGQEINNESVFFLPAFDEFLISYKDRSSSIDLLHAPKAFTNNGIFRPVIVMDGRVEGTWKRTFKKDKVIIETDFFMKVPKSRKDGIFTAAERYADFMQHQIEIKF
ncbi:MAG TPA: winged helix DNA-binding domain-containing protein [Flavobacterium sp.]|jgi:hypothetical protein